LAVAAAGALLLDNSVADPDFYPSRIPDPKTARNERAKKKLVVITFFVATNFTKLKIILFLKR
jgi:hypothetical protein